MISLFHLVKACRNAMLMMNSLVCFMNLPHYLQLLTFISQIRVLFSMLHIHVHVPIQTLWAGYVNGVNYPVGFYF